VTTPHRLRSAIRAVVLVAWAAACSSSSGGNAGTRLTAGDGAPQNAFGTVVALSGETALVGAPGTIDSLGVDPGSAYVFALDGGRWTQKAELTAIDRAAGDQFGSAVALSGNTALVGAQNKTVGGGGGGAIGPGAAYAFTFDGGQWTQQAELTATDGALGDGFGHSVALSGNTALVGASGSGSFQGSAYLFTFDGTHWTQQAKLTASDGSPHDEFGASVAISGNTALVGTQDKGTVYVFNFDGTAWTQASEITTSDGVQGRFGYSVALSGSTAILSEYDAEAAVVFTFDGARWIQQAKLTPPGVGLTVTTALAGAVALSGNSVLLGPTGSQAGAAFLFTFDGTRWTLRKTFTASGGAQPGFGCSVALSGDTALVGSYTEANAEGAAYAFKLDGAP
jgi:hypothetical protein